MDIHIIFLIMINSFKNIYYFTIRDIIKYRDTTKGFKNSVIHSYFDLLRELVNIYIVKPENINNIIREGRLGHLDFQILKSYIMLREDYKSADIENLINLRNSGILSGQDRPRAFY